MLHIILGILKIIGILLAVLFLLILTVFLVILFVPVRYQIQAVKAPDEMSAETELSFQLKLSWLLRMISAAVKFSYGKGMEAEVRLFGRLLPFFRGKSPEPASFEPGTDPDLYGEEPETQMISSAGDAAPLETSADTGHDSTIIKEPAYTDSPRDAENTQGEETAQETTGRQMTESSRSNEITWSEELSQDATGRQREEIPRNAENTQGEDSSWDTTGRQMEESSRSNEITWSEELSQDATGRQREEIPRDTENMQSEDSSWDATGRQRVESSQDTENMQSEDSSQDTASGRREETFRDEEGSRRGKVSEVFRRLFRRILQFVSGAISRLPILADFLFRAPEHLANLLQKLLTIPDRFFSFLWLLLDLPENAASGSRRVTELLKKFTDFKALAREYEMQEAIGDLWGYGRDLIRHYGPRRITGYMKLGTGDPAQSAQLTGLIYLILPAKADGFTLETDFYEAVFETRMECQGRIRVFHLIRIGLKAVLNRRLRRLVSLFLRKRSADK